MPAFEFKPTVFVQPGYEHADGDWPVECIVQINQIRDLHPEIQHWGNLAVGSAWGDYSQEIMAVGWVYSEQFAVARSRNSDFLAYLYVRQIAPTFDFGGTGSFSEEVYELGKQEPWLGNEHTPPAWAN